MGVVWEWGGVEECDIFMLHLKFRPRRWSMLWTKTKVDTRCQKLLYKLRCSERWSLHTIRQALRCSHVTTWEPGTGTLFLETRGTVTCFHIAPGTWSTRYFPGLRRKNKGVCWRLNVQLWPTTPTESIFNFCFFILLSFITHLGLSSYLVFS